MHGDGALVLGADYRGLGIVRSLGRRGIPVWVIEHDGDAIAAHSRFALRRLSLPDGDDVAKARFLLELGRRDELEGWALFPTGDESARLVAEHHDALSSCFRLTTPAWDVLRLAYDKRLTYELATVLRVAIPNTWYPRADSDLGHLSIRYPAILKPAVKPEFNRLTAAKAWRVNDLDEFRTRYEEACRLVDPSVLIVQELIPGDGNSQLSFAALCQDGRPIATIVARRDRQYPVDFGRASTFVQSIECPEIVEPSQRLLKAMRFTGLVEIEYKRDQRDGVLKLLDINPRAWGWHSIGAPAGVDFPYLAWRLARGEYVPSLTGRPGVRWVRLSTDLPTSLGQILRRKLSPLAYLASLRHAEGAIFQRDDPVPGLAELPLLTRVLISRMVHGNGI